MKRYGIALTCALLLTISGAVLYAESSSTLSIEPSDMKDGDKKTFTDNGRTITVTRDGNTTHVQITDADKTEKLTITREGDQVRIGRLDSDGRQSFTIGPDRRKVIIDGVPLSEFESLPRFRESLPKKEVQSWFVCPKDKTMLRVPAGKEDQTFKCPLDGTPMEKRKGRGFTLFFDDSIFESNAL